MQRVLVAALLAAAAVTPARATTSYPGPGALCGFATYWWWDAGNPDMQVGVMYAGPVVAPGGGTPSCSIQWDPNHADPDAVTVTPAPYAFIQYVAARSDDVYYCTAFQPDDGSPRLYWSQGAWTTDPNTPCGLGMVRDVPPTTVRWGTPPVAT
jgi:hypothetical protein